MSNNNNNLKATNSGDQTKLTGKATTTTTNTTKKVRIPAVAKNEIAKLTKMNDNLLKERGELLSDIRLIAAQANKYIKPIVKKGNLTIFGLFTNLPSIYKFVREVVKIIKIKGYVPAN